MPKKTKQSFEEYFGEYFGERWGSLKESLLQEKKHYEFVEGLEKPYYLDLASLWVARALEVQEGDAVLDLCAAPGGKTLCLATALKGTGTLTSNDRSRDRRGRLQRVVEEHLPEAWRTNHRITGFDAAKWGMHEKEAYDKILLDAPCSSERHLVQDEKHLKQWSPARTKNLAIQQMGMCCSALDALRVGGSFVYSTCSLSALENEELVAKFLKKRRGKVELIPLHFDEGEACGGGWIFLPDQCSGWGPLFCAKFKKVG